MTKNRKAELLCPAGNLATLKCAVDYGADAVYIGGQRFGLRAMADNFTLEDMAAGADYAHSKGGRLYVTVNIFAHNRDVEGLRGYFEDMKQAGLE